MLAFSKNILSAKIYTFTHRYFNYEGNSQGLIFIGRLNLKCSFYIIQKTV
jgi:hypothetical protein